MKDMKNNVQKITFTALMAAILCVVGPFVFPIGMVPMSFANMAIYLTIILLDKKRAVISTAVYLLIGFVGIPVFSGFTGGAGKLFGPTGGYLAGYLILSWSAGGILEILGDAKRKAILTQIFALMTGTLGLYMFGTLWMMYQSSLDFRTALSIGVIPFVLFDIVKIVAAVFLGKAVRKRIGSII